MERVAVDSSPALASLYARAVVSPLLGGGDELPDRELVLERAPLEPQRVARYARVCGFRLGPELPGTYPHVLAFPLQMSLMTDRSFPFSVLGLVHVANRIEVLEPIPLARDLELAVSAHDLRPHRRGRQFDMVSEARLDGRPVWRGRSTYLKLGDGSGEGHEQRDASSGVELGLRAVWRISGDVGRRYASASGDRNPIHLHPLTARALGQPTAIAHGMWTKARCLSAFEGRFSRAYTIDVAFRAPLRIPSRVHFLAGATGDGYEFEVRGTEGERSHLAGSITAGTQGALQA